MNAKPLTIHSRAEYLATGRRVFRFDGKFDDSKNFNKDAPAPVEVDTVEEANLISSKSKTNPDMHFPVLDFDIPAHLEPSSTPGHSHLYLGVQLEWDDYVKLLGVLEEVGIIQTGYSKHSVLRGASFVRKPGVVKEVKEKVKP